MTWSKQEQIEAIKRLKQDVKKGDVLFTVLRHTSSSGMLRVIDVVKPEKGSIYWYGYNIAIALNLPYDTKNSGVRIQGAGMDMGFALIYDLAVLLFKDGYSLTHRWL